MANADASKEVSFVWTMIIIFMFLWLSVDIFNSLFYGETLMMRHSRDLYFAEHPIFFIFTVAIKLIVYSYCCFYLYKRFLFYKNKFIKRK